MLIIYFNSLLYLLFRTACLALSKSFVFWSKQRILGYTCLLVYMLSIFFAVNILNICIVNASWNWYKIVWNSTMHCMFHVGFLFNNASAMDPSNVSYIILVVWHYVCGVSTVCNISISCRSSEIVLWFRIEHCWPIAWTIKKCLSTGKLSQFPMHLIFGQIIMEFSINYLSALFVIVIVALLPPFKVSVWGSLYHLLWRWFLLYIWWKTHSIFIFPKRFPDCT